MSFQSTNIWARGWSYTWDTIFIIVLICGFMVLLSCIKWLILSFKKDADLPFKRSKKMSLFFGISIALILAMVVGESIWRMDAFYGISTFFVAYWWHYLLFSIFTYIVILIVWIFKSKFTMQFPLYKEELKSFGKTTSRMSKNTVLAVKNIPSKIKEINHNVKQQISKSKFNKKNKSGEFEEEILSPTNGKIVQLNKVEDEAFSTGLLGMGFGIKTTGKLVEFNAPIEGKIATIFPTKHAFGIETKNGTSILIHIGIDTVKLDGEHFKTFVKQGDFVKVGQKIIEANIETIQGAGYDTTTMIVFTPETKGEVTLDKKIKSVTTSDRLGIVKNK